MRETWNKMDMIDYIKNAMLDQDIKVISFDIFDTLLYRPFYDPIQLFKLMDRRYALYTDTRVHFSKLRLQGEKKVRASITDEIQEVTLDDIYNTLEKCFEINHEICQLMKREEIMLEKRFCYQRRTGKELFDYAVRTGKKVVLISDMYLPETVINDILTQNKYSGYNKIYLSSETKKRKLSGDIYRYAIEDMGIRGNHIIHLGDNWQLDCEVPEKLGIRTIHFPKSIDVFENHNQQYGTNNCGKLAIKACGKFIDYEQIQKSVGYGCMIALVANKYFDNPFRRFELGSDLNKDPYFVGYYVLGMHIIGVLQWMEHIIIDGKYERILFTSRDGWLIKKAYEIYREYNNKLPETSYIYVSRMAVLPAMIKDRLDLLELPIDVDNYSPEKLIELLGFCIDLNKIEEIVDWCNKEKIHFTEKFETWDAYRRLINFLWKKYYNAQKHKEELNIIKKYFEQVKEKDIFFDMGYSARIQYAINSLSGRRSDVMFIHSDAEKHYELERIGRFRVHSFYDFIPYMSDVIREITMSETEASCVGYRLNNGKAEPVFTTVEYKDEAKKVINEIHNGALDFVKDFYKKFYGYAEEIEYKSQEVSMPWEGFLRFINEVDSQIFSSIELEDKVFAGEVQMNMTNMIGQRLKWLPDYAK